MEERLYTDGNIYQYGTNVDTGGDQHPPLKRGYANFSGDVPGPNSGAPRCDCGMEADLRTVGEQNTKGNAGLTYYTCGNMAGKCKFFSWTAESEKIREERARNGTAPGAKKRALSGAGSYNEQADQKRRATADLGKMNLKMAVLEEKIDTVQCSLLTLIDMIKEATGARACESDDSMTANEN